MKVQVNDWSTDGFPTNKEMEDVCKIGQGDETCIWLVCGANGFECSCNHKPHALLERWRKGMTIAKRDGCDAMNNLDTVGLGAGVHEIEL